MISHKLVSSVCFQMLIVSLPTHVETTDTKTLVRRNHILKEKKTMKNGFDLEAGRNSYLTPNLYVQNTIRPSRRSMGLSLC